jgi:hypothetical protein
LPASPATVFRLLLGAFFCFHDLVLQSVEERGKIVQDVRPARVAKGPSIRVLELLVYGFLERHVIDCLAPWFKPVAI